MDMTNFYCRFCECIVWHEEGPASHNDQYHSQQKDSSETEGDYEGY